MFDCCERRRAAIVLPLGIVCGGLAALLVGALPWLWFWLGWQAVGPPSAMKEVLAAFWPELRLAVSLVLVVALLQILALLPALLLRRPVAYRCLHLAACCQHVLLLALLAIVHAWLAESATRAERTDPVLVWRQWLDIAWPLLLTMGLVAWLQLRCSTWAACQAYRFRPSNAPTGSVFFEWLRSGGRDRDWSTGLRASVAVHAGVVIVGLLSLRGCLDRWNVPEGTGEPQAQVVAQKVVREKQERILTVAESPIEVRTPELDDSPVVDDIRRESQQPYEASQAGAEGAMGQGGPGPGGWPQGVPGGMLRFIQLRYGGERSSWNDGFGDADVNFLRHLASLPSVRFPVATQGEAMTIAEVARGFERGFAPPVVYMTGNDGRWSCPVQAIEDLRRYLQEDGGLLFADAGSIAWHGQFCRLLRRVFPGRELLRIADDDLLLRRPYAFPDGIDPFFGHGGQDLLGIRHQGRWAVVYHPGDVNDCWKTGAARVSAPVRQRAFRFGINVIVYAIEQSLRVHSSRR